MVENGASGSTGGNASPRRIGDDAVRAATGKDWAEWFEIIDAAGGREMDHRQIVAVVAGYDVPGWWQQSVTVTYELERGLREPHQQGKTFQCSKSKTVAASVSRVFGAWHDPEERTRWLGADAEVRTATADRSLRLTWGRDGTSVEVYLEEKGESRCRVSLQHSKLPDGEAVEDAKEFWTRALARLKNHVEGG